MTTRKRAPLPKRYCYRYTVFIDSTHAITSQHDLMVCVGRRVGDQTKREHSTRFLELARIRP